jgi:D-cysteine desulfhydrase
MSAPRLSLASLPTPIVPAPRLSERLGLEVWLKRDDLTGVGLGGNKARKLEFLLGAAAAGDADFIVTGGGPGSNHIQITAAATARVGIGCHLVLYGQPPEPEPVNLALARRLGARVTFTGDSNRSSVDPGLDEVADALRARGHRPYVVGRGGATPVGCLGYVEAAYELADQLNALALEPTAVFLSTGSCGTHAGLLLGTSLLGAPWRVVGASVSRPVAECITRVADLAAAAAQLIGTEDVGGSVEIDVRDAIGPGYGKASPAGQEAAQLAAATEGLLLDSTFTAKAFAILVEDATGRRLTGPMLFLHTGGTGGLMGGDP